MYYDQETQKNMFICACCGEEFSEIFVFEEIENDDYCKECAEMNFVKCEVCEEYTEAELAQDVQIENESCEVCLACEDKLLTCDECGTRIVKGREIALTDDMIICYDCKDDFETCDECGTVYRSEEEKCPNCKENENA